MALFVPSGFLMEAIFTDSTIGTQTQNMSCSAEYQLTFEPGNKVVMMSCDHSLLKHCRVLEH